MNNKFDINPSQPAVAPDYLLTRQADEQPEFSRLQAAQASYHLSDMEGTMDSAWNLFQRASEDPSPILKPEELNKKYPHLTGTFKKPMSTLTADREVKLEEQKRRYEQVMQNSPQDFLGKSAQLAGGLAGGIDTADIAIAAILSETGLPFLRAGDKMTRLQESMHFFKSNLVENSLSEAVVASNLSGGLRDYGLDEALTNVGVGTLAGQGLYEGARGLKYLFDSRMKSIGQKVAIANEIAGKRPDLNSDMHILDEKGFVVTNHVTTPIGKTLSDRPFYTLGTSDQQLNAINSHSDAPFHSLLGKEGVLLVDNKNAAVMGQRLTQGNDSISTKRIDFEANSTHNLLDGETKISELEPKDLEAVAILQKHLGEDYTGKLKDESSLRDIFERIDEDLKNSEMDDKVKFATDVKAALSEMKSKGVDGIKLDYSQDPNIKSNAVLLFGEDGLRDHKISDEFFEKNNEVTDKENLKERVEEMNSFKSDQSFDSEVFAKYKEIPDKFVQKTIAEASQEVEAKIKEAELAHKSGGMEKSDYDNIVNSKAEMESELVAIKMAEYCLGKN